MGAAGGNCLDASAKGRTISITLPSQGYLNPLESYLRFDLGITSKTSDVVCVAPRILNNVHTMFRRLRVLYGSLVIEDIQLYGALVRTLTNVAVEKEYQDAVGGVLEGMGSDATRGHLFAGDIRGSPNASGANGISGVSADEASISSEWTAATAASADPAVGATTTWSLPIGGHSAVLKSVTVSTSSALKHTFTIQLASGLLTQQKLIPLKWLANQLTFELELEEPSMFLVTGVTSLVPTSNASGLATIGPALDNAIVPPYYTAASTSTGATYATTADTSNKSSLGYFLDNIYYVAEILEFDSTYDAAFFQGMATGGVPLKFSSWHTHQHILNGSNTIVTIQERARSVKSAFSIIRSRNDQTATTFLSDPYWTYAGTATSSTTYWSEAGAGIDEFQWRIGGRYFPSQPVKCTNGGAEPLIELQKALNLLGDYSLATPISVHNWYAPRGVFTIAGEFESTNGLEMSGINAEELADLALIIKLNTAASFSNNTDLAKMYLTTFVHYDSLLIIRREYICFIILFSKSNFYSLLANNVVELVQ